MSATQHRGGCCLCGAVRYAVRGELRTNLRGCHCSQCRKTSGNFVVATACLDECLIIDDPQAALAWYESSADAKRGFCKRCGSSLFWKNHHRDTISIMAGTLDHTTDMRICGHIYTADAADYVDFGDAPCSEGNSPPPEG